MKDNMNELNKIDKNEMKSIDQNEMKTKNQNQIKTIDRNEKMEKKIMLVAINAKYIHSNLAVYCLKKYAGEYEKNVLLAEYTINQCLDFIVRDIYKQKPDVIAFSCYIWNINYVTTILKELRKVLKDCEIWVGGPEVSYRAKGFLEEYPEVNGVMVGEGEKIFKNLLRHWISKETDLAEIKGIVYRNNGENHKISETPLQPLMDLSEVPFPYDNMDLFKNKIIYYETSRGCPFSCSYCLSSIDKKLRFRNMVLVKKELQFFLDHKIPQVKFVDRTFNCKKNHAMEIWKYIFENDNGITNFHFEISADLIDEEELALFAKMRPGLIQLEIGVQTTNQNTITEINRTMNLERLKYVVDKINSFGNIHQHLDLIAGLPYENYESFIQSFNDVYSLYPEQLQLGFLKVLSGAKMQENADQYGLVYTSIPPYEVLYTNWITFDQIIQLKTIENMVEIYYNSRQFTNTLKYLINEFKSPFLMFDALGKFYELHKLDEAKHSRIQNYEILLEFVKTISDDTSIYSELLTFDVYLRENIKSRPSFSREPDKEKLRSYYQNYKNEGKNIHIESFSFDMINFSKTGKVNKKDQVILFDYRVKNPITLYAILTEL